MAQRKGWDVMPEEELAERVSAFLDRHDRWVIDGNYGGVRALVWAQADAVVWPDPPRLVNTWRVVRRSFGRALTGEELYNGNHEDWRRLLHLSDPEESIIAWTWVTHGPRRAETERLLADPRWARLPVFRLRSYAEIARWTPPR